MISPARTVAFEILSLVENGGYATDLLVSRTARLDSRDAGLASGIVLGTLRYQAQLDYLIEHYSSRPAARLDYGVRIALRMGIFQLRHLDRIPPHAAVSESVEIVKRGPRRFAASLVNAVLRKVNRNPVEWPDLATELSTPAWILERWQKQYGEDTARKIALASLHVPATYIRVTGAPPAGLQLEATSVPGCYRVLEGDATGQRIQDIGAQTIVPLLALEPGQTFLDLCAAPGNKTAQALESGGVRGVACDLHLSRLRHMRSLGCALVALDGTSPLPFAQHFDRILVDAPCSGTGTLARNPEIKWRLKPADLADLHTRQVKLLRNALERLAPRGRLVYSTCSLEREENEAVIEEVCASAGRALQRIPGIDAGDGFFGAVLPSN